MSFSPSFTTAQTPANPSYVIFEDTSVGSDPLIASRRITIIDCNGNFIVPSGTTTDYINWSLTVNPISLDLLSTDTAVNVQVDWLDSSTNVLYTVNTNYCLAEFSKQFLYYLIQLQSLNYQIIQDSNYWGNVGIFWTNIRGAINAVEIGNDIFAAQVCLNRTIFMSQNQSFYF